MTTAEFLAVLFAAFSGIAALAGIYIARRDAALRAELERIREYAAEVESGMRPGSAHRPTADPATTAGRGEVPPAPKELVEACASGRFVIFAGSGLAAQAGLPTWTELVNTLIADLSRSDALRWADLSRATSSDPRLLADVLRSRVSPTELRKLVAHVFAETQPRVSAAHWALAQLPARGVITISWDLLLDTALAERQVQRLSPRSSPEEFASALRDDNFFLVHASGILSETDELIFTVDDYRAAVATNPPYARFISSLFNSETFLFVGSSVDGIEAFLRESSTRARFDQRHYSLVESDSDIELQAERMLLRYNVELIPYVASPGHPEVDEFINALLVAVRRSTPRRGQPSGADTLRQIDLLNIGPHRQLTLDVTPSWNVLLGDNGSGKSSVLRAVALALAGDDERAVSMAGRLLRAGASSGSITLRTEGGVCATELVRDVNRVRILSTGVTPVQTGSWLAVGFPPLRGVTAANLAGPSESVSSSPAVEDILPLLAGSVDSRLDSLKQWVVNTYLRDELDENRQTRLLETFFELVERITPGVTIEFDHVDQQTWDVMVGTADGVVPVDVLSQGMNSILTWAGTLLQRLYETYPEDPHPEEREALVVIDEIDAHLHPGWQSQLVPVAREIFPNVQFLATTHSPLIVGNLREGEVVQLRRDDVDGIVAHRLDTSFRGLRADQILTGPAFDLESSRDRATKELMREYRVLLAKPSRTRRDRARIDELSRDLGNLAPSTEELESAREAANLVEEWMQDRVAALSEEDRERLVSEARLYITKVRAGK